MGWLLLEGFVRQGVGNKWSGQSTPDGTEVCAIEERGSLAKKKKNPNPLGVDQFCRLRSRRVRLGQL